jgi:hypothetical protein
VRVQNLKQTWYSENIKLNVQILGEVLSPTPAVISVPYSASVPQKPRSMRALGLVINQQKSDCETRHPHVVESPPADGYITGGTMAGSW